MTEAQQMKANDVVNKINKKLKNDGHFEKAWYTWYTNDKVEFAASIKEFPLYKYVSCEVRLDDIDVDRIVSNLCEDWKNTTSPKDIKSFVDFISFGEKYGWD